MFAAFANVGPRLFFCIYVLFVGAFFCLPLFSQEEQPENIPSDVESSEPTPSPTPTEPQQAPTPDRQLSRPPQAVARPDALQLYRNGSYGEAIDVTLQEIARTPQNMDAYAVLGWSLVASGRYRDAIEYSQQALRISSFDRRILGIAAEANYYLGNNIEALALFERYVTVAPNGSLIDQVYYFMGEIFARFGEYHHADISLSSAVYLNDDNPRWWTRLGFVREQNRDFKRAFVAYTRALELNPQLEGAVLGAARTRNQRE